MECTRSAGCACPQCDISAAEMDAEIPIAPDRVSNSAPPARQPGWQEREAYGIPEPDSRFDGGAPYLLVCHPRPEILGMCYRGVEKYLREHRGWARRYSKNGNPKPGTGPETQPWDIFLGGNKAKRVPFKRLAGHRSYSGQLAAVNYAQKYQLLDNKDQLAITLRKYCARTGIEMSSLMPETHPFQPNSKRRERQLDAIVDAFSRHADAVATQKQKKNIWILKQSDINQGKGCILMDDVDEIRSFLGGMTADAVPWVVQQYVERPLLYVGGRKFDIRVWCVVRPDYSILLYKEGVIRTCSATYDVECTDISDSHAHLSNHCLAESHEDYGKYEPTNELWYAQFDSWLQANHGGRRFETDILPSIQRITVHTLLAAKEEMENPAGWATQSAVGVSTDVTYRDIELTPTQIN